MSALDVLMAAEAAASGDAQSRASVLHRHLEPAPMTLVAYRMAGEAGAPLGIMFGTSADEAELLVAPEPRNRTIRFREVFEPLADALTGWLQDFFERVPNEKKGPDQCVRVPQIWVPNRATANFVDSVLGRSLRYLRSSDDFPISDATVSLGAHMTWFGQQANTPGSSVMLAATDLLRRHWATGQSSLEDEDLHVALAWIDPGGADSGLEASIATEARRAAGTTPSAGPTPDASWDRDVLEPLIESFNTSRDRDESVAAVAQFGGEIRAAVADALAPTWSATWRSLEILRSLPIGASVAERHESDRKSWSYHVDRFVDGRAVFRINDSPKQAAWTLSSWEDAQDVLDAGEALDDPLVLAGLIAAGEALLGDVTALDSSNMEQGPRRRVRRPLVTLRLREPCPLPLGTNLYWTDRPDGLRVEVVGVADNEVVLKVDQGMTGDLPEVGTVAAFVAVSKKTIRSPRAPQEIPWTHTGAASPAIQSEVPE